MPLKGRFDLTGRNFVVTGGGRGIGYAAARGIAEFGGNVSILDYSPFPVKDFENLEREFGIKAKYIRTDVTDQVSLQKAFDQTIADFKTLDGWLVESLTPYCRKTKFSFPANSSHWLV